MYHICTTAGVIRVNLYTHSTNILSVSITCVGKNTALPQVGKETSDWRVQPWILSPPSYLLPSNHVCTRGLLYFVQPWKLSPSRYLPPPNHVCTCCLLLFVQLEELHFASSSFSSVFVFKISLNSIFLRINFQISIRELRHHPGDS